MGVKGIPKDMARCVCGRLYRLFNMTVRDQTVCPKCVEDAEAELLAQET